MLLFFLYFLYLTLLYRYRASDFQFPFGPSTSVLPFGQAQAELRLLPQAQAVLPFGQAQAELRDIIIIRSIRFNSLLKSNPFNLLFKI